MYCILYSEFPLREVPLYIEYVFDITHRQFMIVTKNAKEKFVSRLYSEHVLLY